MAPRLSRFADWLPSKRVPRGTSVRHAATLPEGLKIAASSFPGAGKGVYAAEDQPAHRVYGSYQGRYHSNAAVAIAGMRAFTVPSKKPGPIVPGKERFVDASFGGEACWMSLVNDARDGRKCNLLAFIYRGRVWYMTRWKIRAGTELSVGYGKAFPWHSVFGGPALPLGHGAAPPQAAVLPQQADVPPQQAAVPPLQAAVPPQQGYDYGHEAAPVQ